MKLINTKEMLSLVVLLMVGEKSSLAFTHPSLITSNTNLIRPTSRSTISSIHRVNIQKLTKTSASTEQLGDDQPLSSSSSSSTTTTQSIPDYGKTTIEIDTHTLHKHNQWRRPDLFGQSLIQQTVDEMSTNEDIQSTTRKLQSIGLAGMTKEERTKRRRALDDLGVAPFNQFLYLQRQDNNDNDSNDDEDVVNDTTKEIILQRSKPQVLQLNIGLYCNQACAHCHVESSPLRTESMTNEIAAKCLHLLQNTPSIHTLDITGGAPELNDNFRFIVKMARSIAIEQNRKLDIIDRCNLTVLQEPGQEDLIPFLVENDVHVIASLPCYSENNVDKQRGNGVFDRSISALIALNDAGYGQQPSSSSSSNNRHLKLDLVYNPLGAFLPPKEKDLEVKYKQVLSDNFGITFNSLYTMTNMPVKRFADFLYKRDELKDYMDLLVRNFNFDTLTNLMCRNTISIGYDGKIYDCDFNQQLGFTIGEGYDGDTSGGKNVFDITSLDDLACDKIRNDNHCFGCTAGMGSS